MQTLNESVTRRRVADWEERLRRDHSEATECRDCEETISVGLLAFEHLTKFKEILEEARSVSIPALSDAFRALDALTEAWLHPVSEMDAWIRRLDSRGHRPDNLEKYEQAKAEITKRVSAARILQAVDEPLFSDDEWESGFVDNVLSSAPLVRLPLARLDT